MQYETLKKEFYQKIHPSYPNEWDVDEILLLLENLEEKKQFQILDMIPAIWPVHYSLCLSALRVAALHPQALEDTQLKEWIRKILDTYEKGGLLSAQHYLDMSDIDSVSPESDDYRVHLQKTQTRLQIFGAAFMGREIPVAPASSISTDTKNIYLPEITDLYEKYSDNLLFLRFAYTLQLIFLKIGSFNSLNIGDENSRWILDHLKNKQLAADIYQLVEIKRSIQYFANEFSGLFNKTKNLRLDLARRIGKTNPQLCIMKNMYAEALLPSAKRKFSAYPDVETMEEIYQMISSKNEEYLSFCFEPLMTGFTLDEARRKREIRISNNKKQLKNKLNLLLIKNKIDPHQMDEMDQMKRGYQKETGSLRIIINDVSGEKNKKKPLVLIGENEITLPQDIVDLLQQLEGDLGSNMESIGSSSLGVAGHLLTGDQEISDSSTTLLRSEFIYYDEWDYRRNGYRKNWCSLRERKLNGVKSDFIQLARTRYGGLLKRLRHQFEMMKTEERLVRRRKDGDDLDLDEIVDSFSDQAAGLPPSERIHIQRIKNDRNITTLFLTDMSNSTEGWVGTTIKEALLMLCEALETVGDGYGIYGFSGMRRMRCEIYEVKNIKDRYDSDVLSKLAAISPMEYTRMGPAVRHMTAKLNNIDTRHRLLIMLSDGKPEDYDDYKGKYAIEDTRKALAEAKGKGIHPFCITIDKEAHKYLGYLFGEGNYIFIKNINDLPRKITEVYRLLTH